jgi:hypothetical protein
MAKWNEDPVESQGGIVWAPTVDKLRGTDVKTWSGCLKLAALTRRPGNEEGTVFVDLLADYVNGDQSATIGGVHLTPAQARELAARLRVAARAAEKHFNADATRVEEVR